MKLELLRYLPLLVIAFIAIWLLVKKWGFIMSVLSDKGEGSATRTAGMIFVVVVAFNEVYTTLKTQAFNYQHLVAILIAIGVLFGFIKVVDLFSVWKGGKPTDTPEQVTPSVTTTTTTEVK